MRINEFMCQDVCFVKPDCNIYDAARIMNENHIGCIPICNDEKNVVGVLTDRDIVLRSVACDKNAKTTPVSEIMTTNVYTCKSEQDIEDAQYLMEQNQIRRIPIVDNTNKMVGILSTGDLAHHNQKIGEDSFSTTMEYICNCKGNVSNCG